jgi:hypothetical protein
MFLKNNGGVNKNIQIFRTKNIARFIRQIIVDMELYMAQANLTERDL